MQLENFEKWFPFKNAAAMYYIENISYDDGIKIRFTDANGYGNIKTVKTFVAHFQNSVSYFEVDETYSDGFWVDNPSKAWTFYKTKKSPFKSEFYICCNNFKPYSLCFCYSGKYISYNFY